MPHGNMVLVGLTLFVRRIIRPTLTYAILCPLWIHWKACWSLAILLWNSIVWNRLKMIVRYSEFPLEHGDFASCHLWTTILPLEWEIAIGFTTWIWGVPLLIAYQSKTIQTIEHGSRMTTDSCPRRTMGFTWFHYVSFFCWKEDHRSLGTADWNRQRCRLGSWPFCLNAENIWENRYIIGYWEIWKKKWTLFYDNPTRYWFMSIYLCFLLTIVTNCCIHGRKHHPVDLPARIPWIWPSPTLVWQAHRPLPTTDGAFLHWTRQTGFPLFPRFLAGLAHFISSSSGDMRTWTMGLWCTHCVPIFRSKTYEIPFLDR